MGSKTNGGFTVIETMLFLAVTGLLAAVVLVGSGIAIGQQRYRDSVNSFKSYIQQQYDDASNVSSSRDKTWTCNDAGQVNASGAGGGEPRGTSDCVIMGRYITIDETGTKLTTANVVGVRTPGALPAASDIAEITTNYTLGISPIDQDTADIAWGAQVVQPKTTTPLLASILILKSPLSGTLLTFTTQSVAAPTLVSLVTTANFNIQHDFCVNADTGSFVGRRLEVRIAPYASSQGAVSIPPESESICD